MGVFMASVSFGITEKNNWEVIKPQIESMFKGLDGLTDNLDSDGPGYAIVSPYGEMGIFLAELPEKISKMTGGFAVFANCCDSDFALMELYHNGTLVEKSCIGECYEEFEDFVGSTESAPSNWLPLLVDRSRLPELEQALGEVDGFAEDNLRLLSEVTQLPIFDDELVFGMN
jgi:hypothetical protein